MFLTRWLIHRPTRDKLILGFGLLFGCLVLVIALAWGGIQTVQHSQQQLAEHELADAEALSALRSQVNGMQATVSTMMLHRSRPGKEAWHQEAKRYTQAANETMQTLLRRAQTSVFTSISDQESQGVDKKWAQRITRLAVLLNDFEQTQNEKVIPLIYADNSEEARHFTLYIQTERYLKIAAQTEELASQAQIQAHAALEQSRRQGQRTIQGILFIGAFSLIFCFWVVAYLTDHIAGSLSLVSNAAERIADGDLMLQLPHQQRRDEIGVLMSSFNRMIHSLRELASVADQIATGKPDVKIRPRSEKDLLSKAFAALDFQAESLRQKNALMETDLNLAREIQQAFLPLQHRHFQPRSLVESCQCSFDFCHHYESSNELGGDFFDIWEISENEIGVFICDVMGHGVRSALVTAVLRGLVEELRPIAGEPGRFLTEVNRSLVAILQRTRTPLFATAFYLIADAASGQWRFANAGHPAPLWLRGTEGKVACIPQATNEAGPALGVIERIVYPSCSCPLHPQDRILLTTDGVFEASNTSGEEYGEDRLRSAAEHYRDLMAPQFVQTLLEEIRRFSDQTSFEDDVCLINIEVSAPKIEVM
ncbi:phosphoserine phosphatase RsbP [Abditibacteriota bacterium]|nr:phosphoserine phosphatase RsbP [Abditibacteriota bacterium]